jgi:hypothetical protein
MLHNSRIYASGTAQEIFDSSGPVVRRFIDGVSEAKEVEF